MPLERIAALLKCVKCDSSVQVKEATVSCRACRTDYPIIDNVVRFLPEGGDPDSGNLSPIETTVDEYFGFEWSYFKDWGFIPDGQIPPEEANKYIGGRVSDRIAAFDSKCRMTPNDLADANVVLDAGCGNGRYTYEAARRSNCIVVGVDIGTGSTRAARRNTADLDNVVIIQASLFNLPFQNNVIDACFSNGVLMHTGDARRAFAEVARTVRGTFVAHVYHKLNPLWEINDAMLRSITTRLGTQANLRVAAILARIARLIDLVPYALPFVNYFIRLQTTTIHMYDWYSAPIATHHTADELSSWFTENNFRVIDSSVINKSAFRLPWYVNLKGVKSFPSSLHSIEQP